MYLLDTRIFLWFLSDDKSLTERVKAIIENSSNSIFVSAATIWEIAIKVKLGRLKVPRNIEDYIANSGFEELVVNSIHASNTRSLYLHHKDPFDRILVSQAKVEGLTILTHDSVFTKYLRDVVVV